MTDQDSRSTSDEPAGPGLETQMETLVAADSTLAPIEAAQIAATRTVAQSEAKLVLRRFVRHRAAMTAIVILLLLVILAFSSIGFGPIPGWWKQGYEDVGALANGGKPTLRLWPFTLGDHPFGQDNIGRDYFARTMRGMQQSILIALLVGIGSTVLGTVIGAIAGYFRGWVEAVLMRLTDVVITIPLLAVAAVVGHAIKGGGIVMLGLLLGAVTWTGLARIVRGEFLSLREKEFVDAARTVGASPWRIIFRHILPNCVGVITVSATLSISGAILLEASLSFLNFGISEPDTSLGQLLQQYRQSMETRPYLFWWPGILIVLISLTINFIGDGLRDAFDPRQNRAKA